MTKLVKLPEGKLHRELLADLLGIAHAGPTEKKGIIEKRIPKSLGCKYDGKPIQVRELLLSTTVESTTLLQTEVNMTLIEGAQPMKAVRNAFPVLTMKSKVMQVNVGEAGTYAPIVPEGSEIPVRSQNITPVTFTAVKRGLRPLITKEMIKFSQWDTISMEVSYTGAALENTLNRSVVDEFLGTLAATATLCTDFGNAGATPLTHIEEAITTIKASNYLPTRVLFQPACLSAYRTAVEGLYFDGVGGAVVTGTGLPRIHGLDVYETSIADDTATYVWGWGTDNYLGGVVYDPRASLAIGMAEDITVEDFYDPIRQLQSMSCTIMYDAQCLSNAASNLLQY